MSTQMGPGRYPTRAVSKSEEGRTRRSNGELEEEGRVNVGEKGADGGGGDGGDGLGGGPGRFF